MDLSAHYKSGIPKRSKDTAFCVRGVGEDAQERIVAMKNDLFTRMKLGAVELQNRIVMAPMTRLRATEDCLASPVMVEYYRQRASAGLIITEGSHPSPMGRGYTYPPGIHTPEQAAAWRKVTDAVHEEGGRTGPLGCKVSAMARCSLCVREAACWRANTAGCTWTR